MFGYLKQFHNPRIRRRVEQLTDQKLPLMKPSAVVGYNSGVPRYVSLDRSLELPFARVVSKNDENHANPRSGTHTYELLKNKHSMARRRPYTRVRKENQLRADHVNGMGDVTFLGFQCLNFQCTTFISFPEKDFSGDFSVVCPDCGYVMEDGSSTKFYDYELVEENPVTRDVIRVIEEGAFEVNHRDYIDASLRYKYCIVCNTLKPLDAFGKHRARATGRQGECTICKTLYNAIKNQTRVPDQHREASQKRRLYVEVAGASEKLDTKKIFSRFEGKCFKCNKILIDEGGHPIPGAHQLDHTLPAYYLWPMTTDNATLLCRTHNNQKSGNWPSVFYSDSELRTLSAKTGISYKVLVGDPEINPEALEYLSDPANVLHLISKYAPYMDEVIKLRNRVLITAGLDFFQSASGQIAQKWIDAANAELNR